MKTNTKENHTPAPWKFSLNDNTPYRKPEVLARNGAMCVAASFGDGPEAEANAHLVSASPDLLAVAEKVARWESDPDRYAGDLADIGAESRAAIAKARGGAK